MEDIFLEYPNFHSFFIDFTKDQLKVLLEKNGWKIRKQSWTEFECFNEWSQLNLSDYENSILLNGVIINPEQNFEILLSIFKSVDAKYKAELYDENKNLIFESTTI